MHIYLSMYWLSYCILDKSYQWHNTDLVFWVFFFKKQHVEIHAFSFKEQSYIKFKETQIYLCYFLLTPL